MQSIQAILALPDKCPIDQVQGKVNKVYELKSVNGKNKQSLLLADAAGTKLMVGAWEHSDLAFYEGKEVIISAGPKGGMKVNIWNGKTGIDVSRTCTFQLLAVHNAQSGEAEPTAQPAPQKAANPTQSTATSHSANTLQSIHPATVGMCINQACAQLIESGQPLTKKEVWKTASMLVKVALHMEKGGLYQEEETPATPQPQPAGPVAGENEPF